MTPKGRCENPVCNGPTTRVTSRVAGNPNFCLPCSFEHRGQLTALANLSSIQIEHKILFLEFGNCKSSLLFVRECGCENRQTPDQITQDGPMRCQHSDITFWRYLEEKVREETGGAAETFFYRGKKKKPDCVTPQYVFEIKASYSAIVFRQEHFNRNHKIYGEWARRNGKKYFVLVAEDSVRPAGLPKNVLSLNDWYRVGFRHKFVRTIRHNLRNEWLTESTPKSKSRRKIVIKFKRISKKMGYLIGGAEVWKYFGMSSADLRLKIGGGRYMTDDDLRKYCNLDLPGFKSRGLSDEQLMNDYITLLAAGDNFLPSEPQIVEHLKCGIAKIRRILTGDDRARNDKLIKALKRLGVQARQKDKAWGLNQYRSGEEKALKLERDLDLKKYTAICQKIGFALSPALIKTLGLSYSKIRFAATGSNDSSFREVAGALNLRLIGRGQTQQSILKWKNKLYTTKALSKLLKCSTAYINLIFSRSHRRRSPSKAQRNAPNAVEILNQIVCKMGTLYHLLMNAFTRQSQIKKIYIDG